ncbi:MAG TPA: hypothetical protein DDW78_04025 [Treponema sp.]|nr:hypothetical protein [Treponema sp.]
MKQNMRKFLLAAFIFLSGSTFWAAEPSDFTQGELYFRQDEPQKAVSYLKKSIENGGDPKAYIYLAMCYFQQGKYADALSVCASGMEVPGVNKKVLAFDAGNIAFAMENYAEAEKWYSLAIAADPAYAAPVLNRANTFLQQGKLEDSKGDYQNYLVLEPESPQAETIARIIALIDNQVEEQKKEEAIRVAEEKKLKEEEHRIAAERARREHEEAERRKKLLEDVASSLQGSGMVNMSAGAEGTVDYGYESELE